MNQTASIDARASNQTPGSSFTSNGPQNGGGSDVDVYDYSQTRGHKTRQLGTLDELQVILRKEPKGSAMRWIRVSGEVDPETARVLKKALNIPTTFMTHILQHNAGDDTHFAGSAWLVSDARVPDPCACMSFGAPLVQRADPHSVDVARLWVHLIICDRTVVTFTTFGGVNLGIFPSSQLAETASRYIDESWIHSWVHAMMDEVEWQEHDGAWYLVTRILWAIQIELFSPMAQIQEGVLASMWMQCQRHLANDHQGAQLAGNSHELMEHVYTLVQRCNVMLMLGNAYKEALEELVRHNGEFENRSDWPDQHLRAELKSILLDVKNTTTAFEAHISMMDTIAEMWTKRLDLGNAQVNTLLAMVATIFLPLTFLCGVYGMNFNNAEGQEAIPILSLGDGFGGYLLYWGLCNMFGLLLLVLFNRWGWFPLVGITEPASKCVTFLALLFLSTFLPGLELILREILGDPDDLTPDNHYHNTTPAASPTLI